MTNQFVTGTLRLPNRSSGSQEEVFHKILSRVSPDRYLLKRISIFETPLSAELEYVKAKSKSRKAHRVILVLSKNKTNLHFKILSTKWTWPWSKNDFDTNVINSLENLRAT